MTMPAMTAPEGIQDCTSVSFASGQTTIGLMNELGAQLGFGQVIDYPHFADMTPQGLSFFIVHGGIPDSTKMRLVRAMRNHSDPLRRFAPMVCIVPSGPRHQLVPLIEMGFDEVLFMSETVEQMRCKLNAQINRQMLYVQTKDYFGPDRRRIELVDRNDPRRKYGGSSYRRFAVVRHARGGIDYQEVI